jgi:hypothetical protein
VIRTPALNAAKGSGRYKLVCKLDSDAEPRRHGEKRGGRQRASEEKTDSHQFAGYTFAMRFEHGGSGERGAGRDQKFGDANPRAAKRSSYLRAASKGSLRNNHANSPGPLAHTRGSVSDSEP